MESEPTAVLHPGGRRLIGVGSPPSYQTPKTYSFGGSRIVWTTGKGERALLPGHADCDPSQCCRQPADTGALCVTLVKKPRMPLLTSCCLLLLMADAPFGR